AVDLILELFPAFNYARDKHETIVYQCCPERSKAVLFKSDSLELQLDVTVDYGESEEEAVPFIKLKKEMREGYLGEGVTAQFHLEEGQSVSFIIRENIPTKDENLTQALVDLVQTETGSYWYNWISKCKYKGRYLEVVLRS